MFCPPFVYSVKQIGREAEDSCVELRGCGVIFGQYKLSFLSLATRPRSWVASCYPLRICHTLLMRSMYFLKPDNMAKSLRASDFGNRRFG